MCTYEEKLLNENALGYTSLTTTVKSKVKLWKDRHFL